MRKSFSSCLRSSSSSGLTRLRGCRSSRMLSIQSSFKSAKDRFFIAPIKLSEEDILSQSVWQLIFLSNAGMSDVMDDSETARAHSGCRARPTAPSRV